MTDSSGNLLSTRNGLFGAPEQFTTLGTSTEFSALESPAVPINEGDDDAQKMFLHRLSLASALYSRDLDAERWSSICAGPKAKIVRM